MLLKTAVLLGPASAGPFFYLAPEPEASATISATSRVRSDVGTTELTVSICQIEACGDDQDCADSGNAQPADERSGERRIRFATFSELERHREETDDRGEGRHQDRTQADGTRPCDSLLNGHAFVQEMAREFHDQDAFRIRSVGMVGIPE